MERNLKVVNYVDVTFNLNDGSYQPYQKPNDETHHINIQSDHPPSYNQATSTCPQKSAYHNYHHQKIYFTKRNHIMSNASSAVGITKN